MQQINIKQFIPAVILLALIFIPAAGCDQGEPGFYTTRVPILFKDLKNVESLHLELEFDDRIITPVAVEKANGVPGIFTYGFESTSNVVIGIARAHMNGSGTLAYISFKVNASTVLPTDLVLSNVIAVNAETKKKIDVDWINGSINVEEKTFTAPEIVPLQ